MLYYLQVVRLLSWICPGIKVKFGVENENMPERASATILYVEDNPDNRILIRRVLSAEGYTVVEAAHAEQAFRKLQDERIDLILMDINMPNVDGYTLTSRIRKMEQYTNIPIVAVTANVMRGDREKSLEAGCDGYIQKPIDIDTLAQQIERFLSRRTNA
jgi:two-component system cell cycle response regulator DivK